MLPQKASYKPSFAHLVSLSEHERIEGGQQPVTLQKLNSFTPHGVNNNETKAPPPGTSGRSRSGRESTREQKAKNLTVLSPSCKPSAERTPSQAVFVTTAKTRTVSGKSNSRTTASAPFHGRSISQQLEPISTRKVSSLKTPPLRQSSMNSQKPAFSTLQQHYSPKKARSGPTSPSTQSPRKAEIFSADLFNLQKELAQLHLLHRSAVSIYRQWERNAGDSFQQRFNTLHERHVELKEIAYQQQILINQLALVDWSRGKTSPQISEAIHLLSRNISDVCSLLDTEGKYARVLEIFESWFTEAIDIRARREVKAAEAERDLHFISGIGDGWKAEAMVLERELNYCLRDLKGFGTVRHTSSLGRVLSLYGKLVVNLLDELDVIQWVENETMAQEACWVDAVIHTLASHVSNGIGSIASTGSKVQC